MGTQRRLNGAPSQPDSPEVRMTVRYGMMYPSYGARTLPPQTSRLCELLGTIADEADLITSLGSYERFWNHRYSTS